jgi:hypothetical protein
MAKKENKSISNILKKSNTIEFNPEDLRPQDILSKKENTIIGFLVFAFTLVIYMLTNAKSLSFWDAGEYITSSSILGVPHPPGNPFYIMLGRFFTILGSTFPHAAVVSFISSLFSAFAVMFTYLITVQLLSMNEKNKTLVASGGIIAAILTAFSFTFWMNAIEAEVYAGLAFIINICVWLTFVWVKKQKDFSHQNILLLIIYILFLGFCIHQTSLQVAPALLFICVYPLILPHIKKGSFWAQFFGLSFILFVVYVIFNQIGKATNIPVIEKFVVGAGFFVMLYFYLKDKIRPIVWFYAFILILLGFSPHLFLYIRSASRPFMNEGYPHTFDLFMDYILRRQYGDFSFMVRRAAFFKDQLGFHFLRYFSWQFMHTEALAAFFKAPQLIFQVISNLLVTFLGLMGFYHTFKKNRHSFNYLTALFFMVSIAMIFVMNLSDKEVRDRDYFFTTAYNFWAIAMGIGAVALIRSVDFLKSKKIIQIILLVVLMAYPFVNMASQYKIHDRTGELVSLDYGLNLLNSLEENAIIFTNGDNDTFPLWYIQAVKDPYAVENIWPAKEIQPTQETKKLIADAIAYKNTQCAGIRKDVTVANLSLLNTPWYIRQLRDKEGVVFSMDDDIIDKMTPIRLPEAAEVQVGDEGSAYSFKISLEKETVLMVNNLAVIQIIKDNFGKRPIYFAVTCSENSGFGKHLRNEGMVDRVVAVENNGMIDAVRLEQNLTKVFKYRGIENNRLYKDDNMSRLITNYGAAFMRLSDHYKNQKDLNKASAFFDKAMTFISKEDQGRFIGMKALLLYEGGKTSEAEKLVEEVLSKDPQNTQILLQYSYALLKAKQFDKALDYLKRAATLQPDSKDIAGLVTQAAIIGNQRQKGIEIITIMTPSLPEAMQYLNALKDPTFTIDASSLQ